MIKTCIKRSVTVVMVTMMVLLGGTIAYNSLDLAMTPDIDLPIAMVSCTYTGAAPEEMEDLVTKPIEESLATITGVDKITSSTSNGSSMVMIQFVDGTDIDVATNDMRDKLDRVKRQLPDDADDPSIMKMDTACMSAFRFVRASVCIVLLVPAHFRYGRIKWIRIWMRFVKKSKPVPESTATANWIRSIWEEAHQLPWNHIRWIVC